ncbi:aspartic peptidase domain-containing protein [Scheffersomyces amazonensis]|uniref:aspartic peptidase domain-containing protein n=1 Tax=Scheffersomyces amazonensis TaxID=1078765 RepID=UPI00315CBD8A
MKLLPLYLIAVACKLVGINADIRFNSEWSEPEVLAKRDTPGYVDVPLQNMDDFYMVKFELGSEKDEIGVIIDTGSSDLFVIDSNVQCYAKEEVKKRHFIGQRHSLGSLKYPLFSNLQPFNNKRDDNLCTRYGSFDPNSSNSFASKDDIPPLNILYADGTTATGNWGSDVLNVGDVEVNDVIFAVVDKTSSDMGVFGIGFPELEQDNFSPAKDTASVSYNNFPMTLKDQGLIDRTLYSLYLGQKTDEYGQLLFGAVDAHKFNQLTTVPVVASYDVGPEDGTVARLNIMLSGVSFTNGHDTVKVDSSLFPVTIDSGSTYSYLAEDAYNRLAAALGASLENGDFIVPCTSDPDTLIIFNFSGFELRVPLGNILNSDDNGRCALQIGKSESSLFGDNIIRHAYWVFDLDNRQISIGNVVHSDTQDIQVVKKDEQIPKASEAESYSSTSTSEATDEPTPTSLSYPTGDLTEEDILIEDLAAEEESEAPTPVEPTAVYNGTTVEPSSAVNGTNGTTPAVTIAENNAATYKASVGLLMLLFCFL